ncbi:cytidylate kinase family protein [Chloroflexota bacterium]
MSIITISRGSYSRGKEIAEKVAEKLGYECIGRDTLIEASEQFNIPEIKLIRTIHDAPSILERFTYGKERYIAYIQAALLRHVKKDNVIYHGLAGHFFLDNISHVLKVLIISDMEDRVALEMEREGISIEEARRILRNDDEQRRKWSKHLYGIDTADSSLYDLVLHIKNLIVNDAVDIICNTVRLPHFQTTYQSQKVLEDRLLAAEVKAALIEVKPDIEVSATDGIVLVNTKAHISQEEHLAHKLREIGEGIPGVQKIVVNIHPR